MMKRFAIVVAASVGILIADSASAQTLVDQMRELFLQSVVLSRTPGGTGIIAHTPVQSGSLSKGVGAGACP